jgi:opacity protein-like surface antigen
MRNVAGNGIALLTALAMAATGGTASAADSAGDSAPPWAATKQQLLFETGAFGALALGGHFHFVDSGADNSSSGSTVSLADHGAFALTADLRADEGTQYELFYSREATGLRGNTIAVPRTNVTVEYLHLGGTLLLNDEPQVKPYIVGGLGVTRLTPSEEGNTDTRFSVSLGVGLRWPVTKHFAVRLEGRGFATLVNPDAAVFCRSDQNGLLCRIRGSGQTFIQGELLAGAAFAF